MFGFFKNKGKRRQERGLRLEVKLRADAAERGRRRIWTRLLGGLGLAGLMVGTVVGGSALARHYWLYRVEALALRRMPVTTDGVLSTGEILAQAGLRVGMNTLALDLPKLREQLLRHPRVRDAEVDRELPDTIRLRVKERFPVARVKAVSQQGFDFGYLLDEGGYMMLPFNRSQVPAEVLEIEAQLPILVGAPAMSLVRGRAVQDVQVRAALRFLADFEASPMAGLSEIVSVELGRPQEIEVLTVLGSRVVFAARDAEEGFALPLMRWAAVHQDAAGRGRLIGALDLSVTNNAPLRWLDAATAPSEGPRPVKAKRKPLRRNV